MMIDFSEKIYFVSGIDTGIGKTVATGALAHLAGAAGKTVLTQKPVQTGGTDIAEDIVAHDRVRGGPHTDTDHARLRCTYLLPYPASPHLAAALAGVSIDCRRIDADTQQLGRLCDVLLIEGAGGLMVPLNPETLTADFVRARDYPLILVTCGRLGSINHTLLTLHLARQYGIRVAGVVYNHHFDGDALIAQDTHAYLSRYARAHFPAAWWLDLAADAVGGGKLKTA